MAEAKLKSKDDIVNAGLVGFFDILGYQNLLESNKPEDIANTVFPVLTDIHNKVIGLFKKVNTSLFEGDFERSSHDKILKRIKWLIFSDTILISLPFEENDNPIINWLIKTGKPPALPGDSRSLTFPGI